MIRLWYLDGTYMDTFSDLMAHYYENDPEWDHSEELDKTIIARENY